MRYIRNFLETSKQNDVDLHVYFIVTLLINYTDEVSVVGLEGVQNILQIRQDVDTLVLGVDHTAVVTHCQPASQISEVRCRGKICFPRDRA